MKKTPVAEMESAGYKLSAETQYLAELNKRWMEEAGKASDAHRIATFDSTVGAPTLKWEDPRKMLASPPKVTLAMMSPESMAQKAIKQRVLSRLPKAGTRYKVQTVETRYDLARDATQVSISMVDTHTFTEWVYTYEVDMYSLANASPGDWQVLDKRTDVAVKELVEAVAKAMAVNKPKPQENDDVPNQTQWTYVEKPRHVPVIRTSTSGSAEVYSLEDVPS